MTIVTQNCEADVIVLRKRAQKTLCFCALLYTRNNIIIFLCINVKWT